MGAIALLALFTFVWYFLYKRAVRNEIEIVTRLYSKFNPPHDWESMIGRSWAPILAVLMTLTFIALAWFIDRIQIYCVILMLMGIQDVRGNSFVRRNLAKHFIDQRYVPLDSDLHKPFIMRRREIAEEYWINRPHIERIGLMIVGFMLAFLAAISEQVIGIKVWKEVPYLIVIFTIFANEVTMVRWRRLRDKALETVDLEQEHADRRRTGELTPEMTATPPPAPSA
ncbi:MAG: hypothetical protein Q8P46_01380 [Hyphomicrobiales bacterium]|nr:hypothetical protein [Hyphomicrobiales bacterium]